MLREQRAKKSITITIDIASPSSSEVKPPRGQLK
jgi:hypothetical protein